MQGSIYTIVIGSGMAGMSAASQIAKNGHHVLVLEANNYIGGRMKTTPIQLSNKTIFPFDEGANWIHGSCKNHPITQLSKEVANVKMVETDDDKLVAYDENGQDITKEVDQEYYPYKKLMEKIEEEQFTSTYDAIGKRNGSKLTNKNFMFHVSTDIEFQTASSITQLSAEHGQEDPSINGKEMLIISGYQSFPTHLSHNANIKVLLNHPVTEVAFNGVKTIVKCSNGAIFDAPYVVIAVPIGVLKSKSICFIPELPQWKQEAIQKISFGNVCKVLVILKKKLAKQKQDYIGVIPNDVEKRGSATYYLNIQALTGFPALMTFGLGPNADEIQMMPENQLKQLIASRLRVFADPSFTAHDFDIARSSWKSNPCFQGTYSYAGVHTQLKHWKNMAKPIFQRNWHFCGEHTHCKYRATVHGAYLTGFETANTILKKISLETWQYKGSLDNDKKQNAQQKRKTDKKKVHKASESSSSDSQK